MTFQFMCVYIIFSSVSVTERPTVLEISAHSINHNVLFVFLLFVILVISRFGFESWIWVLIASVPDLCILFTFCVLYLYYLCPDIR